MDPKTAQILLGAAGSGGAAAATYVDDVFSTFLYDGTNATKTVTNGIDLSGEGGLVWIKARDVGFNNYLFDTERGAQKYMRSDTDGTETTATNLLSSFNSDGFSLGNGSATNSSGNEFVSWSFRKAPGFFDVVTYSGDGTNRAIAHSLGSKPGWFLVKSRTDNPSNWGVYHQSLGATKYMTLDTSNAAATSQNLWNNTEPTATHFTVHADQNKSGHTYVAYLFAHDDQSFGTDSDEAIIKCGSYTGNGTSGHLINVGFEPQWLLWKNSTASSDWRLYDVSREFSLVNNLELRPNEANAEINLDSSLFSPDPVGYRVNTASASYNGSSNTYIYVAIRRPHKPPEAATDVYDGKTRSGTGATITNTTDLDQPDFVLTKKRTTTSAAWVWSTRLNGYNTLKSDSSAAQSASVHGTNTIWDYQDAISYRNEDELNASSHTYVDYFFRRAPGFLDIVTYKGTGSDLTVNHNLGVTPELIIAKKTTATGTWYAYPGPVSDGVNKHIKPSSDAAVQSNGTGNSWSPTATTFNADTYLSLSDSGAGYIAFLFASIDGICKIGTYSGSSSAVDVDCGFTAGARFIMIKRIDVAADWFVLDSDRGIVSGNDPHLRLNLSNTELSNYDNIDPLNAGFTVTSSAPGALNSSGGTFLFLAIA